jgi:protein O-GlcNAc transferase
MRALEALAVARSPSPYAPAAETAASSLLEVCSFVHNAVMEFSSESFEQAVQLLQAGRLTDAEQICRQIVAAKPNFADAWHLLGVIALQTGKNELAVDCLNRAVAANPADAEAFNNLGIALKNQNLWDEAIDRFRQAVKLKPNFAEANYNLGNALQEQAKPEEAIACYLQALVHKPDAAEVHSALGRAFQYRGNFPEAIDSYRQALELDPNDSVTHFHLALALQSEDNFEEAISEYRTALELNPAYGEAHFQLGGAFQTQGKTAEAIASYRQAVELMPASAEAFNCLGAAYKDHGMLDEAFAAFGRALELNPNYATAHHNVGIVLKDTGQLDQAIASFRRALAMDSDNTRVHSSLLFTLLYERESTPAALYEEHRRWNRQHAEPLRRLIRPHTNDSTPGRRLKVGYVSPDFRENCHALFTVPLFSSHNHTDFEYFCYSSVASPDSFTERLRACTDVWRNVARLSDEQVAEMIREDRIDILVDLTMHTAGSRLLLFARKPAPIQVCWLAYPGTTGLSTMDFRLTDPYLDPLGLDDRYYSEESIRLPDTFWCYDPLTAEPAVNPLPAVSNGFVTFGSPHNFCKVNDSVLKVWARVLLAVQKSRLIILTPQGSHRQRTLEFLEQEGVSATRIEFFTPRLRRQYLEFYHQVDIVLDSFPYNGHTTSLDSFWMGVPVVTLVGQTVVGRAGSSQLTNLGLPELIAHSPEQYVHIAQALALDLHRLGELRKTFRERMQCSPLMDSPRFARNIELAYRQMWRKWCEKQSSV